MHEFYYIFNCRTIEKTETKPNKTEIKQFSNVLFQPKQNGKTAVKRFSCFSQSQSVSSVYAKTAACRAVSQTLINKHGG